LDALVVRGYVNAFAGIALPNPGSIRLFEARGFEQIALQKQVGFKLGRWRDVGWWQLRLAPATVPPPAIE
jgi:L-amino acid N-acyltransferase YncA